MNRPIRIMLSLVALGSGIGVFSSLKAAKPEPDKKERKDLGTLVEVMNARSGQEQVVVHAQGSVMPAEQVVLQPEVTGRIKWRHPSLVPGGIVKRGELLVRLDAESAKLVLQQQEAQVNRAELDLQLEQSRKQIAEREWALLNKRNDEQAEANPLALRDPQMKTAAVQVEAAKSARAAAKLNVSRTVLNAPFNAFVQQASADVGQLVGTSSQIATLVGVDRFWVQISVPLENLAWIRVPGVNAEEGSRARIVQEVGDRRIEREGRAVRLLGDLDPVGRMARVLVEIEDPFNLRSPADRGLPLLVGAFVDVIIDGGALDDVFEIPRTALRDGDHVYLLSDDQRLETRAVKVVWRTPDSVLVSHGIADGDQIVSSRLGSAIDGMLLRLAAPPTTPGQEPTVEHR